MVTRTIFPFDNEALVVDASSPFLTPGSSIVNASDTPLGTIFVFQAGFDRVTVTIDDTGGSPDVFEDDLPNQHVIIDGGGLVANGNGVESESEFQLLELDASGNTVGPLIPVSIFSQNGQFSNIWGLSTSATLVPGTRYTVATDTVAGSSPYEDIICFCKGTMIQTATSSIPVESLAKGASIKEFGGRAPKIRAVFSTVIDHETLSRNPKLRPICISAGALGNGLPHRDLRVSRQHRMLVSSKIAKRMFGAIDVLVPAIKLTELPGIYIDENISEVEYFHILFDKHEVIFAEGAPSESLFTGPEALKAVSPAARDELFEIFPDIASQDFFPEAAAIIPPGKDQKKLIARHLKNQKPILELMNSQPN
ncbi:Hint domain-containing protein [Rhodobacteraceae bacterium]|nr:Hint domain-containing protein [Paracoccaceae bacterium]